MTSIALSSPGGPSRGSNMTDRDKSGQSAADEEEQRRRAILAKAMMDDLGTARVENLPLEDVDLPPRHGRHDGRGHSRLTMPRPAPAVSDIWAEAQRQGVFNDDDAIAVRELDDLGGGRFYATRQQEVSALASRLVRGVRDQYVSIHSEHWMCACVLC